MSDGNYDVIVIGAGITGLTATKELLGRGLSVANIEGEMFGGLVININELDGKITGSGADLASDLMMEVTSMGAAMLSGSVTSIRRENGMLNVVTDSGGHGCRAVIVASGARLKRMDIPGETAFQYKGVGQCADCDGPLYQGADVVVVGGGDSAVQEATVIAQFCRQVHLVVRGSSFSAQPHLIQSLQACSNVTVHWATEVEAILGSDNIEKVRVKVNGGTVKEISCSGFFAYIGLDPANSFVAGQASCDADGFLLTDDALQTTMNGVFAAGAARAGYGGMLEHAVAEGCIAAQEAAKYLEIKQ